MGNSTGFILRIIRLCLFFIPFFTSVIFGDRPVREVIQANRLFTTVFVLLLAVSFTLVLTTRTLSLVRQHAKQLQEQLDEMEVEKRTSERHVETLREELTACIPHDYNANRILDRLRSR